MNGQYYLIIFNIIRGFCSLSTASQSDQEKWVNIYIQLQDSNAPIFLSNTREYSSSWHNSFIYMNLLSPNEGYFNLINVSCKLRLIRGNVFTEQCYSLTDWMGRQMPSTVVASRVRRTLWVDKCGPPWLLSKLNFFLCLGVHRRYLYGSFFPSVNFNMKGTILSASMKAS